MTKIRVVATWAGSLLPRRPYGELPGAGNAPCFHLGGGYMGVYKCKTSLGRALKIFLLPVCTLHLKKKI